MKKIILTVFLLTWTLNQVSAYNELKQYTYVYETQVDWKKVGTPTGTTWKKENNYTKYLGKKVAHAASKTPSKITKFTRGFILIMIVLCLFIYIKRKRKKHE